MGSDLDVVFGLKIEWREGSLIEPTVFGYVLVKVRVLQGLVLQVSIPEIEGKLDFQLPKFHKRDLSQLNGNCGNHWPILTLVLLVVELSLVET